MKKILKIVAIVLVLAFIVIQFIRPDFTNPPVNPAETLEASTEVPEKVQAILTRSCRDCHSNETKYPWYSYIQPSASFLAGHIEDGRKEMNFSVWNTYTQTKKARKLEEICSETSAKQMPLPSYLWIHWNAKLSDEEIKILCDWTEREKSKISGTN